VPLTVELVSPERTLWEGESSMVVARTIGAGDIAFLPGHVPFLGALETHPVTVYPPGGDDAGAPTVIAVLGGFVSVAEDKVTVLSDQAELAAEIDATRTRNDLQVAEEALRADPADEAAAKQLGDAQARLRTIGELDA